MQHTIVRSTERRGSSPVPASRLVGSDAMKAGMSANESGRIGPAESGHRLHRLVFSVVYPAFLGSFIFGLLSEEIRLEWFWGCILALYFTLQQIEGEISGEKSYPLWRAPIDLVEVALMVLAYVSLGLAGETPSVKAVSECLPSGGWLALTFLYPVVIRLFSRSRRAALKNKSGFYISLTVMSLAAAILALFHRQPFAAIVVAVLLIVYLIVFQLFNETLTWGSFRRPPDEAPAPAAAPTPAGGGTAPAGDNAEVQNPASDSKRPEAMQAAPTRSDTDHSHSAGPPAGIGTT